MVNCAAIQEQKRLKLHEGIIYIIYISTCTNAPITHPCF